MSSFGIGGALIGGVLMALSASSLGWAIPLFVVGAVCGLITGVAVSIPLVGVSWAIQFLVDLRHGRPRSIKGINDTSSQAWRLCDLAWRNGRVGSWRDQTVDPERRVASIVWSAVERSLAAESQHADAVRALGHANLKTLAQSTLTAIEQERRSLSTVESNLQKVLDTARGIDSERAQAATDREIAQRRRAEERELLGRLTGDHRRRGPDSSVSALQAERSAGLAAEAQAIAGWLAETMDNWFGPPPPCCGTNGERGHMQRMNVFWLLGTNAVGRCRTNIRSGPAGGTARYRAATRRSQHRSALAPPAEHT